VDVQFANVKVGTNCCNSMMKEALLSWHPSNHVSLSAMCKLPCDGVQESPTFFILEHFVSWCCRRMR
jgi:hypothetical protein